MGSVRSKIAFLAPLSSTRVLVRILRNLPIRRTTFRIVIWPRGGSYASAMAYRRSERPEEFEECTCTRRRRQWLTLRTSFDATIARVYWTLKFKIQFACLLLAVNSSSPHCQWSSSYKFFKVGVTRRMLEKKNSSPGSCSNLSIRSISSRFWTRYLRLRMLDMRLGRKISGSLDTTMPSRASSLCSLKYTPAASCG